MNWHYTIKFSSKSTRQLSYPNYWMNWLAKLKHCTLECCALFCYWIKKANIYSMAQRPVLPDFYNQAINGLALVMALEVVERQRIAKNAWLLRTLQQHPYCESFRDVARLAGCNPAGRNPSKISKGEVLGTFAIIINSQHFHRMQKSPWLKTMPTWRNWNWK